MADAESQEGLGVVIVDAFTAVPFAGNPAAVVVFRMKQHVDSDGDIWPLAASQMQKIAREIALSETAFCVPKTSTGTDEVVYGLRWFTPETEVNLCGHATLATAHVLFNVIEDGAVVATQGANAQGGLPRVAGSQVAFDTASGRLVVSKVNDSRLRLDFPRGDPQPISLLDETLVGLANFVLGLKDVCTADRAGEFIDREKTSFCAPTRKLIVHAHHPSAVERCEPNSSGMMSLNFGELDVRGIAVTSKPDETQGNDQRDACDFISRYFAPWVGIPEDPVTGSLHTVLAVHWAKFLHKKELVAVQASARTGRLYLTLPEDSDRVFIDGYAVTVMRSRLLAVPKLE